MNKHIGKYEVKEEFTGGMAVVYKAFDPDLKRNVAIKQIADHLAADEDYIQRFRKEAETLARINHSGIVQIHEFLREDGNCYIVMEYVDGKSLDEVMKKKEFEWREVTDILSQALSALKKVHEEGIIHRDLKPSNIIYSGEGEVKIMDFGIAKARGEDPTAQVGTARYMPPEIINTEITGTDGLQTQADIYSLGHVMYELLVGRETIKELVQEVYADRAGQNFRWMQWHSNYEKSLPPVKQLVPDVPVPLSSLIRQMIEKDPEKRPSDAGKLLHNCNRIFENKSTEEGSSTDTRKTSPPTNEEYHTLPPEDRPGDLNVNTDPGQPESEEKKSRKWFITGSLLIFVLLFAAFLFWSTLDRQPPEIDLSKPQEGKIYHTNKILVSGTLRDESGIKNVTVNENPAKVNDDGTFKRHVEFEDGRNSISIKAIDRNDNTEKQTVQIITDTLRELEVSKFNRKGGTVEVDPDKKEYRIGEQIQLRVESDEGWLFSHWSDGNDDNPRRITVKPDQEYIHPIYKKRVYNLKTNSNPENGGSITITPDKEKYTHGERVTIKSNPSSGYTLKSWSSGWEGKKQSIRITSNSTITARFKKKVYDVKTASKPEEGGKVKVVPEQVEHGKNARVKAVPKQGWTFVDWLDEQSKTDKPERTVKITNETTFRARFERKKYNLRVSASPQEGGRVTATPSSVTHGEQTTIYAKPAEGWEFSKWSDNVKKSRRTVSITEKKEFKAKFQKKQHKVQVKAVPPEGGRVAATTDTVEHGDEVTVAAVPDDQWTFAEWQDHSTKPRRIESITENKMYIAYFDKKDRTEEQGESSGNNENTNQNGPGVQVAQTSKRALQLIDLKTNKSVQISGVEVSSRPNQPSLKSGDVIVSMNGQQVGNVANLLDMLAGTKSGEKVQGFAVRGNKIYPYQITIANRIARKGNEEKEKIEFLKGISLSSLSRKYRQQNDIPSTVDGLVVTNIKSGSKAARSGLRVGDVILEVNNKSVRDISDIRESIQSNRKREGGVILLNVLRDGSGKMIPVE